MSDEEQDALTRRVRAFYEQYHFPSFRPVEQDGLILMRRLARTASTFGGRESHRQLRVLDAGCGTGNTLIALARHIPDARFLGLDLSQPSLAIAEAAAAADGLTNVEFQHWNLLEPFSNGDPFDVVLCLGVLHHTAAMQTVLAGLRVVLDPEGQLLLWVYGRHGRYRHRLNTRLLAMLMEPNAEPDEAVSTAIEFIEHAAAGAARDDLRPAMGRMSGHDDVFRTPAWVADQFFHPHELVVDLEELLTLVEGAELEMTEWLGVDKQPEKHFTSSKLCKRFSRLPRRERMVALDLLLKPDRYFVVLEHAGRTGSSPQ
jgi:2-polyprenyl-3-methyl-5-hydroxy-6-metoxy-1,4-benzoquinol methylase